MCFKPSSTDFMARRKRGDGIDDEVVAEGLKLIGGEELGFAEFGHVGQQGNVHGFAELFEFALIGEGFGEDHFGAGVDVGFGAVDGCVEPFGARASVRAMIRKLGSRLACTAARMRFTMVSVSTSVLLSRWPQRLGLIWSSMWQPQRPSVFDLLDGAGDVHRFAEAGVDVDDGWGGR